MKKLFFSLSAITFLGLSSHAQGFYLKLGGGYAWPGIVKTSTVKGFQPYFSDNLSEVNKVLDPANASIVNMAMVHRQGGYDFAGDFVDSSSSNKTVHDSYGRGGNVSFAVGYNINPYFGVELGFNYLLGAYVKSTQVFDNILTLGKNTVINTKTRSNGLSITPSIIVYGAKKESKVVPYARLGLILPVAGKTVHVIDVNSPQALFGSATLTSQLVVETQSTVSLGFQGGVGVQYRALKFMNVWGEVNGVYLDVRAKTSTLTKYTIDSRNNTTGAETHADRIAGTGDLPAAIIALGGNNDPLSTYSKVIEFKDEVSLSDNSQSYGKIRNPAHSGEAGYIDENKNHIQQRVTAPFHNIGFNVGVTFLLSKEALGIKKKEKAAN